MLDFELDFAFCLLPPAFCCLPMELDLSPLWISLKTAAVATVLAFILGIAIAGWMFRYQDKGKGQEWIDGLLTLPIILPPVVVGFLLLLLLGNNSPIGQLLKQLGIEILFTWPATVIAATVVAVPLMYKTVLVAFKKIDRDLIRCARTLRASDTRIFLQILLPLAWPGIVAGTVLAFARALGEFGATLMLAGNIPNKTQTIPLAIFFAAESGKRGQAAIWTLLLVSIALSAIAAINAWSTSQHDSQIQIVSYSSIAINRGLTLISRWWLSVLNKRPLAQRNWGASSFPLSSAPPQLTVTLQKAFPDFTLETNFTANGKPLGILGASGSGKSMTLRCIAGLETPTKGQIVLNGRVLFDSEQGIDLPSHQRRIGFVFQNYALFPHMKVAQNIGFALHNLSKAERKQRVEQYVELMQLQGLEKRYPRELSGGQQQRVALARALVTEPEALLLDEPFSALDSYLRSQMEQLLVEVSATYPGVTLFVTHKLEEAYRICSNLLVLSQGSAIAFGRKEDIFERPPSFKVAQLTECKNFSRAQIVDRHHIEAVDWHCTLNAIEPIPIPLTYVGIRAHHLTFQIEPDGENVFPCWLTKTSETQHQITLYIHLHAPASNDRQYHLQAEIFKEKWAELKHHPFPWYVQLAPLRLMLLRE